MSGESARASRWRRAWLPGLGIVVVVVSMVLVAAPMLLSPHPTPAPPSPASPVASPSATPSSRPSPYPPATPAPSNIGGSVETPPGSGVWAIHEGHMEISTDRGSTWAVIPTPSVDSESPYVRMAAVDGRHAWILHAPDISRENDMPLVVYRTADGGRSWQSVTIPGRFKGWQVEIHFADAGRGYVSTRDPAGRLVLYKTDDGGATWQTVARLQASYVVPSDASTLWASGTSRCASCVEPLLQVSRDGGLTWSRVALPGVGEKTATSAIAGAKASFSDASNGFVAVSRDDSSRFGSSLIFRTTDGGRSWKRTGSIDWRLWSVTAVSATQVVAGINAPAVDFTGPVVSLDGGKTWKGLSVPTPPSGTCHGTPKGLYVCGNSTPAYSTDTWISEDLGLTWHRPGSDVLAASPSP